MTVIIEKPAVNLREELASLRNQGGYQEQQFYFDGLVTNGTFDSATTGWSLVTGAATWSGGTINIQPTSYEGVRQDISVSVGKTYQVKIDVTATTVSTGRIYLGTLASNSAYANSSGRAVGTHTYTLTATTSTLRITLATADATGNVNYDNVSVFETDGTDVVHRMPKGWVPKDVYEDGLLQREGAANDYEVVYDGFDYFVKPTVAPSATTQTCVIGVKA